MIKFERYGIKINGDYIINGISFEISTNGIYVLCGESGSGKSTILNAIAGTDYFKDAEFDGTKSNSFKSTEMHYVTVDDNVNTYLNVNAFMHLYSKNQNEIDQILSELSILELKNQKCSLLSRGESERVAIAAALIDNKEVILIDEPTANIDVELSKQVFDVILKYSKEKIVIIATHDYKMIEDKVDGLIYLEEGRIVKNTITNKDDSRIEKTKKKKYVPVKSYFKFSLSSVLSAKIGFVINTIVLSVTFLSLFILFYMTGLDYNGSYLKYIRNSINDALRTNDYLHVVKNEEGKRDLGYIELLEEENASQDDIIPCLSLNIKYNFKIIETTLMTFMENYSNDYINERYSKFTSKEENVYPIYLSDNFVKEFYSKHEETVLKVGNYFNCNGVSFVLDGIYKDKTFFDAVIPTEYKKIDSDNRLSKRENLKVSFGDIQFEIESKVGKRPEEIVLKENEIAVSSKLISGGNIDLNQLAGKEIIVNNDFYFLKGKPLVVRYLLDDSGMYDIFFSDEYYSQILEEANAKDYNYGYYYYYYKKLVRKNMDNFVNGKMYTYTYSDKESVNEQLAVIKKIAIALVLVFFLISTTADIIYLHNINKKNYKNYALFNLTGKSKTQIRSVYILVTSMILIIPIILSLSFGTLITKLLTYTIINIFDPGMFSIGSLVNSISTNIGIFILLMLLAFIAFIAILFPTILMLRRKKAVKDLDNE